MADAIHMAEASIADKIETALTEIPGVQRLKEKQFAAVSAIVAGADVLVCLPTGYGKSLIYLILPANMARSI